jgi:phage terminase large subunit-like protein
VHAYARGVVEGSISAGRYVVAACRRHLEDLELGPARGLIWRADRCTLILSFFEEILCIQPGRPFHLEPFQAFIVGSLFGWYRADAPGSSAQRRRFRTFYGEMGKGNGKTPLAAGIALFGLVADAEASPEIYPFASAKDQARICFNDAIAMVRASPRLRKKIQILTNSITIPARLAVLRPLSSDDKGQHGLRVHMGIGDEIHAHGSAAMIDTIEAGTKNCRNALIVLITNSGHDRRSACWAYHTRAVQMLAGKPDDSLFAFVCSTDPCPKCTARGKPAPDLKCPACTSFLQNESRWLEANPGYGSILDPDYLRGRAALYARMPSKRNNILQLNFCLWTEADAAWADLNSWRNRCADTSLALESFAGRPCWIGLDAANRVDATCLALIFERAPGAGAGLDAESLPDAAIAALAESGLLPPPAAGAASIPAEDTLEAARSALGAAPELRAFSAAGYVVFLKTYLPSALAANASGLNHEAYSTWAEQGHITITPGAITDFAQIEADLEAIAEKFAVQRLQADPRELGYLLQRVQGWASFPVLEIAQGPTMISQPMKMAEGLIAAGLLAHDGNPVLDWMLGNVVQKTTRTGGPVKYYYPTRASEEKKIDGAVAMIIALDGALRAPQKAAEAGAVFM